MVYVAVLFILHVLQSTVIEIFYSTNMVTCVQETSCDIKCKSAI